MQNTALGVGAGSGVATANSVICIGSAGENVSQSCYIGNVFNATSSSGSAVFVNATGKLGTITSSRRFKEKIKPMDQVSKALFALKPVSFRYKKEIDPAGTSQLGLVAEDVEKVNPDLVVRDKEGKPYSVRYDQVNAMLLNEFLKEHRKIEAQQSKIDKQEATMTELKSIIAQQQEGMEVLAMRLEEHGSQIQKVSAQIGVSNPAPQTVVNNR
jgi:antitoxin component HigA of HigAB toxin-antitoxin module